MPTYGFSLIRIRGKPYSDMFYAVCVFKIMLRYALQCTFEYNEKLIILWKLDLPYC